MRTAPGRRSGGWRAVIFLITISTTISCGGGDDGAGPVEPDPNAIKIATLVPGGERAKSPSWSPDGSTMAYTKDVRDNPQQGIYTVNVFAIPSKGGTQTKLSNQTDNADASTPVWSPDGASILFSASKSGDPFYQTDRDLWIVPATGGTPIECSTLPADSDPIHPDDYYDAAAREWSPDGDWILFDSWTWPGYPCCDASRSFLVPPTGGYPQDLSVTLPGRALGGGTWSPDGTMIACTAVTPGSDDTDIYLVSLAGGTPTLLVGTPDAEGGPCWSTDGSLIAYAVLANGAASIWTVPVAGGSPTKLMNGGGLLSPDWRYLAISSVEGDVSRLTVVPVGGTPTKVAQVDYQHAWYPSWSPDGTKIAFVTGSGGIAVASNLPDADRAR